MRKQKKDPVKGWLHEGVMYHNEHLWRMQKLITLTLEEEMKEKEIEKKEKIRKARREAKLMQDNLDYLRYEREDYLRAADRDIEYRVEKRKGKKRNNQPMRGLFQKWKKGS